MQEWGLGWVNIRNGTVQLGHPCPAAAFVAPENSMYGSCTWLPPCLKCHMLVGAIMWLVGESKTRSGCEDCQTPLTYL